MKIAVGSDHRGFDIKQQIIAYPDLAYLATTAVSKKEADRAILTCATGIGMCMAANKVKGIRAALCHDELSAQISRDHNNSNVLCMSADQVGVLLLRKMVEVWLSTEFSGGRHERRVRKIAAIEEGKDPREI